MNYRMGKISLAAVGMLWLAACDPKTPVQTSDINTQVDQKIAAHNADATAHAGLPIHVSQLQETIGSAQITDGGVTSADIQDGAITSTQLGNGAVGAQALAANAVQTAAIGDLMVTNGKIADATITGAKISATAGITGGQLAAGANITGSQLSATANIAGSQLAAAANIAGTQLAAAANITGTQLSATANITGTQLSATANIAGTQLAAAANIAGTQLAANANIAGSQLAQGTVDDTRVNLSVNGTGNQTAFTAFYSMKTDNAWTMNTPMTITFSCSSTNNDGQIEILDMATVMAGPVTCDGTLKKLTFNADKMKTYDIKYKAIAANDPVTWRSVLVAW